MSHYGNDTEYNGYGGADGDPEVELGVGILIVRLVSGEGEGGEEGEKGPGVETTAVD